MTTLGVLLANCGILASGCLHELPSQQPREQEKGQVRLEPSISLLGTVSPQKHQDSAAVLTTHTVKDSAVVPLGATAASASKYQDSSAILLNHKAKASTVVPLGEAASSQKHQDSAAVLLNHKAKNSAVILLGETASPASQFNIQRKVSRNPGISPLQQASLKLCLHRSILEIYYMDYLQMASGQFGQSLTNWKKLDLLPVQILPDSIRQKGFLLYGIGTLNMQAIPFAVRRTDFDCNMTIRKEGCAAINSAGSCYAKLYRQTELKGYHLLLRHFSSRLDLRSRIGKQAAFELLIAATMKNCDFISDPQRSQLHLTAEITVVPDRLSPASRKACQLTTPLTFKLHESIFEDPNRK